MFFPRQALPLKRGVVAAAEAEAILPRMAKAPVAAVVLMPRLFLLVLQPEILMLIQWVPVVLIPLTLPVVLVVLPHSTITMLVMLQELLLPTVAEVEQPIKVLPVLVEPPMLILYLLAEILFVVVMVTIFLPVQVITQSVAPAVPARVT
jgi:hypothetical protein